MVHSKCLNAKMAVTLQKNFVYFSVEDIRYKAFLVKERKFKKY